MGRPLNFTQEDISASNENDLKFKESDLLKNESESKQIILSYLNKLFKNFTSVIPEVNQTGTEDVNTLELANHKDNQTNYNKIDNIAELYRIGIETLSNIPCALIHKFMLESITQKSIHYNSLEVIKYLMKALYCESEFNMDTFLDPTDPKNIQFLKNWNDNISDEISQILADDLNRLSEHMNDYVEKLKNKDDESEEEEEDFEFSEEALEFCSDVKTPWLNFYCQFQNSSPIYDFKFKYFPVLMQFLKGRIFPKFGEHANGGDKHPYENLPGKLTVATGNLI